MEAGIVTDEGSDDIGIYCVHALDKLGNVKSVLKGVSEARISYGPGYRLYFTRQGDTIVVLLAGGNKSSQTRDIEKARDILKGLNQ